MSTKDSQPVLNFDKSVVITNGASTSDAVDLMGTSVLGFITDSSLDGTSFTFTACDTEGGTYLPVRRMVDGNPVTAILGASGYYATDPADFASVRYLKIVAATTQTGATTIKIVNRRLA